MNTRLKPISAAILMASFAPLSAQAVTAHAIADVHLASSNTGAASAVKVKSGTKALLKFDLSALPEGITSTDIAKATLVFSPKQLLPAVSSKSAQSTAPPGPRIPSPTPAASPWAPCCQLQAIPSMRAAPITRWTLPV